MDCTIYFAYTKVLYQLRLICAFVLAYAKGSVSGSGTGPGDPGSRGPALPDPETFPYEWLGVRQYISVSCISCL